jgi:hypothetical protein
MSFFKTFNVSHEVIGKKEIKAISKGKYDL